MFMYPIIVCLIFLTILNGAQARTCQSVFAEEPQTSKASMTLDVPSSQVTRFVVSKNTLKLGKVLEVLESGTSFEIVFDSIDTLVAFQGANQDISRKLYDETASFVLSFSKESNASLIADFHKVRALSLRAAIEIKTINNLYLDTFIPWSYFARQTDPLAAGGGFPSPARVETRLDSQIYIELRDDGTAVLKNHGYRGFMANRLSKLVRPQSALHVFRGMGGTEAAFIEFMGKFSKGETCENCRRKLLEYLQEQNKEANFSSSPISDQKLLEAVHASLYSKKTYFFTTPEPKWADHWGKPYKLEIQLHSLPELYLHRIYVAADASPYAPGVVEIDFPVASFDEALLLFSHISIKPADIGPSTNRLDPNGNEVELSTDLRSLPLPN